MISCLKPPHVTREATEPSLVQGAQSSPSPDLLPAGNASTVASMYQSAYTDPSSSPRKQQPDASMYQSAQSPPDDDLRGSPSQSPVGRERAGPGALRDSIKSALMKERHERRMSVANEKLLCAQLTIDAVCLSLSSRGEICLVHTCPPPPLPLPPTTSRFEVELYFQSKLSAIHGRAR